MNLPFEKKSEVYDLLYKEKDYAGEVTYLREFFDADVSDIADFGCGTGNHLSWLEKDYNVFGFDSSPEMINLARRKLNSAKLSVSPVADIDGYSFDGIFSLFHVVNYHTTNKEIRAFFEAAARNLRPNGVFCFDFWNAAGVSEELPSSRTKTVKNNKMEVVRTSYPKQVLENIFDIDFEVEVSSRNGQYSFKERHRMRAFSEDELRRIARDFGFVEIQVVKWLSKTAIGESWYGFLSCRNAS